MKKLLLSLGTVATVATPVVTVVACGTQTLTSTKTTEELGKIAGSVNFDEGKINATGGEEIKGNEASGKLGVDSFKSDDDKKGLYMLSKVSDSEGIFVLFQMKKKDENLKSTDPLEAFDNIEYGFFIIKSSDTKEENLDKANKLISDAKASMEKAREELEKLA